jgi:hypothetical protein
VSPNGRNQPHAVAKVANIAVSPGDNCIFAIVAADAESVAPREMLNQFARFALLGSIPP